MEHHRLDAAPGRRRLTGGPIAEVTVGDRRILGHQGINAAVGLDRQGQHHGAGDALRGHVHHPGLAQPGRAQAAQFAPHRFAPAAGYGGQGVAGLGQPGLLGPGEGRHGLLARLLQGQGSPQQFRGGKLAQYRASAIHPPDQGQAGPASRQQGPAGRPLPRRPGGHGEPRRGAPRGAQPWGAGP